MDFRIEKQQDKSVIIFEKSKSLCAEAAGLQNAVLDLIEKKNKVIAVDLSKVDCVTSYGIGMLIYAHTTCIKRDVKLYIIGVNEKVLESLKIVHLDKILIIKDTV
jgi:anti-anti-sigma factor